MNTSSRILIIIPTFNEAENIRPLIERILELDETLDVLVVDDHSPDGTGDIAEAISTETPHVQVIHRPQKLGLGTAYTAGFVQALQQGYDRIITMDADFSHNPRYIPSLLRLSETYDLTIGSRYVPGGGVRLWGLHRRFLSKMANLFARTALGLQAHDCTAGFRCYRASVLETINPHTIRADGYSFLLEMLWRVQKAGFSIGETPIVFTDRRRGASKISQKEILLAAGTVFRLAFSGKAALANASLPDGNPF
ncbi:MAG: polyprenol monophosphomannose synthase [Clostridia bacterium]|nr:MAG: polyprenol monophosphomannose synthase [Clostridia bacterium]